MNPCERVWERKCYSKKGHLIECVISADTLCDYPRIADCYRQACERFLNWLETSRLHTLCDAQGRRRLDRLPEKWCFLLKSESVDGHLSVCLEVTGEGDGFSRRYVGRSVWDAQAEILSPIERFLPRRQARKYNKWEYALNGESVIAFKNNKMYKIARK